MPRRVTHATVLAVLIGASACASRAPTAPPVPVPGDRRPPAAHVPESGAAPASALVATAVALVGTPYRAGGQAPHTGFDCSGFVRWVFGQHGLGVPRTVEDLFAVGEHIDRDTAPAAGDLVFFATEGRGPSHVGIALGNGWFVHAPSARGLVRIESLGGAYWPRRYLGARRLVGRWSSGTAGR